MPRFWFGLPLVTFFSSIALAVNPPPSDPQALSLAAQSIAQLSGQTAIGDVVLTGTVIWVGGAGPESGTATLQASGTGESRMDLLLQSGTRTEVRDAQTGTALGKWVESKGSSGNLAFQNCQTDAVWFFPALSSLSRGPNVVLSYIGAESRNGERVHHLTSHLYQPDNIGYSLQQLSTIDFYLDANTSLPSMILFNAHPDDNELNNIPIEIDFLNYEAINGVEVPMHVQKYMQGSLTIDLFLSSASFNTGIALSNFTVN